MRTRSLLTVLLCGFVSAVTAAPIDRQMQESGIRVLDLQIHAQGMDMNLELPQPVWSEVQTEDGYAQLAQIARVAGYGRGPVPDEWTFEGVYPNPFNPTATVRFTLKRAADVNARLYNVLGQQVLQLAGERMVAGRHELMIQGSQLASGVYFLRLEAGPLNVTRKVVLLR